MEGWSLMWEDMIEGRHVMEKVAWEGCPLVNDNVIGVEVCYIGPLS